MTRSAHQDALHIFGTLITSANPFVAVLIFDWITNIGIWEHNTHICINIMCNKSHELIIIFLFKFRTSWFLCNSNISYVSPFIKQEFWFSKIHMIKELEFPITAHCFITYYTHNYFRMTVLIIQPLISFLKIYKLYI